MKYAAQTSVSSEKSKAEIEQLLTKYGPVHSLLASRGSSHDCVFYG